MKKRDLNKTLNAYQKLEDRQKVKIYVSEIFNIRDYVIEKNKQAGGDEHRLLFSLIITSLEYGVAVGYSAGKRDGRAVRNRTKKSIKKS